MKYYARAGSLTQYEEMVTILGDQPKAIMRSVGLTPAILRTPEAHVPYLLIAELLRETASRLKCPDFGFRLGMQQGLKAFGPLGLAASSQESLRDAVAMIRDTLEFHARGVNFSVADENTDTCLMISFDFEREVDCLQLVLVSLGLTVKTVMQLLDTPRIDYGIRLKIPGTALRDSDQLVGASTEFDEAHNQVVFPAGILNVGISMGEEERKSIQNNWQKQLVAENKISLSEQVESAIDALLPTGECNLPVIASLLGLSTRVLQKRLKKQGFKYADLLERRRLNFAVQRLQYPETQIRDIAFDLNYGDSTAFCRAFKSWTGLSPTGWRREKFEHS